MLKKLAEIGFWLGVVIACLPLLMYFGGGFHQWQLHGAWASAQQETAPAQPGGTQPGGAGPGTSDSAADDGLIRLRIARLHLDAMVVEDVTDQALTQGPGHFPHSALPGEQGNCAIAAHRNVWGCWFANLNQMQPGDPVILETLKHHYTYIVTGKKIISPDDNSVLRAEPDKKELTLITCTIPPSRRVVVSAILSNEPQ